MLLYIRYISFTIFSDPEKLTAFRIWNENDKDKSRVLYVKLKCSKTYETIMGAIVERKPGEDICIQFNTEGSHDCSKFLYCRRFINTAMPKLHKVFFLRWLYRYLLTYFHHIAKKISLEWRMYIPIWNVILSILRSLMNFCTMEMILGSQNWQDYISNGCVHPSIKWVLWSDGVKIG